MKIKTTKVKVVTGLVRLSYVYVWEPKAQKDGSLKYSVQLIIPKSDTKTLKAINDAVDTVIEQNKAFLGDRPRAGLKLPLRDGDAERPKDSAYKDCFFMNVSSKLAPQVVDKDVNPIIDKEDVYSGCYGRVSMTIFPYNTDGGIGVTGGLNNVQKVKDGEPLGAHSSAADDFDAFAAEEKSLDDYGFLD